MFFALWPHAELRRSLHQAAKHLHVSCGGRPVNPQNLHLTLVFLGEVETVRLSDLGSAVSGVEAGAFDLNIERLGYWEHNRVAWAAPRNVPEALAVLVGRLRAPLLGAGFKFDQRDFAAHIT
ncbi:MAG: RNA 2',3'-cyclic phosphodiesterase, partial [Burkholderiales bacterium]